MQLQNTWVAGGGGRGGRGGGVARDGGRSRCRNGAAVEAGRLVRIDDFIVILTMADGTQRSFARNGDVPKVEISDPREGHAKLLPTYTDKDMHDVTAYLVTLK